MAELDPGGTLEVDIEDNASRLCEIVVLLKRLGRRKRHAVVAMLSQEPLNTSEHSGVVVDHKDELSLRQVRWSFSADVPPPARRWLSRQPNRSRFVPPSNRR